MLYVASVYSVTFDNFFRSGLFPVFLESLCIASVLCVSVVSAP